MYIYAFKSNTMATAKKKVTQEHIIGAYMEYVLEHGKQPATL